MINKKQSHGFSLVELMVSMVVGLIILAGIFTLFSTTRKTQAVSEAQTDMVADARFAIEVIAYDLRHAGMWGGTNLGGLIDCKSTDAACAATASGDTPPALTATGDCVAGWFTNLQQPIFAVDNVSAGNPYSTCMPTSELLAGTDMLSIRYADSNLPPVLVAGQVYVRSNFDNGRIFVGGTPPELNSSDGSIATQNHVLHAFAYHISNDSDVVGDGIPALRRAALVAGPEVVQQTLVSGVVNLQVQLGVDRLLNDEIVDIYLNPAAVTAAGEWDKVYSAKIWLVMRTDSAQPDVNTSKTFNIAGTNVIYGGVGGFRHFMVSSVVNLRNLKAI